MNPNTLRMIAALFLLAHGWIHYSLTTVPVPAEGALRTPYLPAWWRPAVDSLWPAARLDLPADTNRLLGSALWVITVAAYTLAGLALLFFPGATSLWQGAVIAGSAVSILLLGLYWHPWLPAGLLIDAALIAAVIFRLPASLFA